MSDINFQPIFDYIDKSKEELKEEILDVVTDELRDVKTSIDNLTGQVETFRQELLVSGHRITRLEDHATVVGEKVGVPIVF